MCLLSRRTGVRVSRSDKGTSATEREPLVVLVPPLLMPKYGMWPLERALRRAGRRTFLFGYPSYRDDIPGNARRLARALASLGEEPLDVVTFSLGGVLLRWAANNHRLPRMRRVVMIGPPNQGTWTADWADRHMGPLFPLLFGAAARQLRSGDNGLCAAAGRLPEDVELGIVAGGTGDDRGVVAMVPGDNDRIVRVEETTLAGMRERVLVRAAHGPLVFAPETHRHVVRFLAAGTFAPARAGASTPVVTAPGASTVPA